MKYNEIDGNLLFEKFSKETIPVNRIIHELKCSINQLDE